MHHMRKNFGIKTWFSPLPVLIVASYDKDGNPDAMNAAWGGVYDTDQVILCLDKSHKSTENIKERKAFTISFADRKNITACDYVGIVSANDDKDKFRKSGFTAEKSAFVDAPLILELPLTLECRVKEIIGEEHIVGEIVNISADESILGSDGKPDMKLFDPVIFETIHAEYMSFGEVIAKAFSAGRELR